MKKTILFSALFCVLGLVAGACLLLAVLTFGWLPNTRVTITTGKPTNSVSTVISTNAPLQTAVPEDLTNHSVLLNLAMESAQAIRDGDWNAVSELVHPEKGVTFTPYSTVTEDNLTFSAVDVADFGSDQSSYLWGYADGSGFPLKLTPSEYVQKYVFNTDYTQAPFLSIDRFLASGNSLENVADAYPDASFVEFYFPGLEDANQGFDWCALKLVFEPYEGQLMLVGIIHSEWTI